RRVCALPSAHRPFHTAPWRAHAVIALSHRRPWPDVAMLVAAAVVVAGMSWIPTGVVAASLHVMPMIDAASEDRILALDPEQISAIEVRDVLSRAPAPRIISLHG